MATLTKKELKQEVEILRGIVDRVINFKTVPKNKVVFVTHDKERLKHTIHYGYEMAECNLHKCSFVGVFENHEKAGMAIDTAVEHWIESP